MKRKWIILLVTILCICAVCMLASCQNNEQGEDGKSAYELYKDKFGYQGTEEQWLSDLVNGKLAQNNETDNVLKFNFCDEKGKTLSSVIYPTQQFVLPEIPAKTGYHSYYWGNVRVQNNVINIYPIYAPRPYAIKLVDEYTGYSEVRTVFYDQPIGDKPQLDRPGYRLSGWFSSELEEYLAVGEPWHWDVSETIEFVAEWEEDRNTLVFEYELNDDGESYAVKHSKLNYESPSLVFPSSYNGKSVTRILAPDYCSYTNSSVKSISVPQTVTQIDDFAFYAYSNLKEINLPDNLSAIADYTFGFCHSLEYIKIPNTVTAIGDGAFYNCNSLKRIVIPQGVTTIGNKAFYACETVKALNIPSNVSEIGYDAFAFCKGLESITVSAENEVYEGVGNCLIRVADKYLVAGCKNSVIPNGRVEEIGLCAFTGCSDLKSIVIPNSVKYIGRGLSNTISSSEGAFAYCTSLTSISIGDNVRLVGDYAFIGCSSLVDVDIAENVSINSRVFQDCTALTTISISDSMLIAMFAGCIRLQNVTLISTTTLMYNVFEDCWSLSSITLPDTMSYITPDVFKNCFNLTEVRFNGTVEQCQEVCFYEGWNNGTSITKIICIDGEYTPEVVSWQ